MSVTRPSFAGSSHRLTRWGLLVAFPLLTLLGLLLLAPHACPLILLDLLSALLILVPPMLAGLWLVPLFRLEPLPFRWHLLVGAALGLGATSLLMLLLGCAGVLHRSVGSVIVVAFAGVGCLRLRALWTAQHPPGTTVRSTNAEAPIVDAWRYAWLLACPFLVLALLAASNAPGFLWQEEGYGYDVLEYHLQLPKEYRQAGRIGYLPHNVYANFPSNVEMLYLLGMIVLDDDLDTGTTANMIHLILGGLAVAAAWLAGREVSPRVGVLSGVALATVGWLPYLSGLAYVENGMLFFGTLAAAVVLRVFRTYAALEQFSLLCSEPQASACAEMRQTTANDGLPIRFTKTTNALAQDSSPGGVVIGSGWIILTGVLCGLAGGCKYTALPMIALPIGVAMGVIPKLGASNRAKMALLFSFGVLFPISPWLTKNVVLTGNPVFPLMNSVFHASPPGWGMEQTDRWARGHDVSDADRGWVGRLRALGRNIPGDPLQRFGPLIFLWGLGGIGGRKRDRCDALLLLILGLQLVVWLTATHLFARFAVVLLISLALLAGRSMLDDSSRVRRVTVLVVLILGWAWNLAFAAKLHVDESADGAPAALIHEGKLPGYEYFDVVNHDLPANAKILLVGDARAFYFRGHVDYCTVFNRNPFIAAVRGIAEVRGVRCDQEIMAWLRESGYTHLLVHWAEIERLRRTYGFDPLVTPELFDRFELLGLSRLRDFPHPKSDARYVTLYQVR